MWFIDWIGILQRVDPSRCSFHGKFFGLLDNWSGNFVFCPAKIIFIPPNDILVHGRLLSRKNLCIQQEGHWNQVGCKTGAEAEDLSFRPQLFDLNCNPKRAALEVLGALR